MNTIQNIIKKLSASNIGNAEQTKKLAEMVSNLNGNDNEIFNMMESVSTFERGNIVGWIEEADNPSFAIALGNNKAAKILHDLSFDYIKLSSIFNYRVLNICDLTNFEITSSVTVIDGTNGNTLHRIYPSPNNNNQILYTNFRGINRGNLPFWAIDQTFNIDQNLNSPMSLINKFFSNILLGKGASSLWNEQFHNYDVYIIYAPLTLPANMNMMVIVDIDDYYIGNNLDPNWQTIILNKINKYVEDNGGINNFIDPSIPITNANLVWFATGPNFPEIQPAGQFSIGFNILNGFITQIQNDRSNRDRGSIPFGVVFWNSQANFASPLTVTYSLAHEFYAHIRYSKHIKNYGQSKYDTLGNMIHSEPVPKSVFLFNTGAMDILLRNNFIL